MTGEDAENRQAPKIVATATMTPAEMLDYFYPVGTCVVSLDNSFNPNDSWVGEWIKLDEGQSVVQAGSNFEFGSTDGSKDAVVVKHSHTVNSNTTHSIPALSGTAHDAGNHSHSIYDPGHTHTITTRYDKVAKAGTNQNMPKNAGSQSTTGGRTNSTNKTGISLYANGTHSHSVTTNASTTGAASPGTNEVGADGTDKNMQPYKAGNIWRRIR